MSVGTNSHAPRRVTEDSLRDLAEAPQHATRPTRQPGYRTRTCGTVHDTRRYPARTDHSRSHDSAGITADAQIAAASPPNSTGPAQPSLYPASGSAASAIILLPGHARYRTRKGCRRVFAPFPADWFSPGTTARCLRTVASQEPTRGTRCLAGPRSLATDLLPGFDGGPGGIPLRRDPSGDPSVFSLLLRVCGMGAPLGPRLLRPRVPSRWIRRARQHDLRLRNLHRHHA